MNIPYHRLWRDTVKAVRELSTGMGFYAYAEENNPTYASLFAQYVIEHLKEVESYNNQMEVFPPKAGYLSTLL